MNLLSQILRYVMPLLSLLIVALLCWGFSRSALWRGRWAGEQDEIIPDSAPRLGLRWRALQAAAVALIGLSILGFIGSAGGPLPHFGVMHTTKAILIGIVTAAATLGILLGAFLALTGGTGWGCMLAALSIFTFNALTSGSNSPIDRLCPGDSADTRAFDNFEITDRIPGVEIWVNNVYLGKTPLRVPREEFLEKVPFLTEIPGAVVRKTLDNKHFYTEITDPTWGRFTLPNLISSRRDAPLHGPLKPHEYYIRARLNGEWGKNTGGGLSGGGGGGRYTVNDFEIGVGFSFPKLEARINDLLGQTRAAGFSPTPDWFKALESLNPPAWRIISEQAARDPNMKRWCDAWAAWHFGLEKATTPDTAWRALEAIARQVNARNAGLAGQAIALLVPKLDPDRLAGETARIIRQRGTAFSGWGYSYSPRTYTYNFSSPFMTGPASSVSTSAHVFAQALILAGEQYKAKNGKYPASFQTQLAPEILRHGGGAPDIVLAANFGGPVVEQYLLRQPWRKQPDPRDYENFDYDMGKRVNKWLKLLAGMNNEIGRRFRAEHHQEVLELARQYLEGNSSPLWANFESFSFITSDPQLAMELWPEVKRRLHELGSNPLCLEYEWKYLVRMEPKTTVEHYLEAWREDMDNQTFLNFHQLAFSELKSLPAKRRSEVLTAIQGETRKELEKIAPARRNFDPRAHGLNGALNTIKSMLEKK